MSGDSALEHSSTNGSKRRRTTTGPGDAPAAKKFFTDAEIAAEVALSLHIREQRRAEVRSIYLNYGTLLKGSETGSEALAFQGLLDCANGSLGARRLAARLVPRFLPRFPSHAEQAFRLLSSLYGDGQPSYKSRGPNGYITASATAADGMPPNAGSAAGIVDDDCVHLEEAMRRDALRGLGNVLEAAAAARQMERNVPVVMELVLFLMRHMRRLHTSSSGGYGGHGSGGGALDTTLPSSKAAGSAPPPKPPLSPMASESQSPKPPEPQPPKPPEPQQPKQPLSDQNVSSSVMLGHGLKHRYIRRNAEAAANAEANGGGPWRARNANRCPSDDEGGRGGRAAQHSPTPTPASAAPLPHGARHEGTDGCGKAGGGNATEDGLGTGKGTIAPAGVQVALEATQDPDSDGAVIRSLLCRAFAMFPRVVLTASLQPFRLPPKQRGHEDCVVCGQLLELLLQPASASSAFTKPVVAALVGSTMELAEARNVGGDGGRGYDFDVEGAAGSNAAAGGAAAPVPGQGSGSADGAAGSSCMAARVLTQLPETQAWFRQLATAIMQGKTEHSLPISVQGLLERLLQYCTATGVPAAAAAMGKISPRASPHGAIATTGGTTAPRGGSVNLTLTRQGPGKPDGGPVTTAAHSMVGSDDNSRSVPMDLDHSISTAVIRPEGSGAVTTPNVAGAGTAATAAALAGPQDTAATPAPPPLPVSQHLSYPQHHHLQSDAALLAGQTAGPATVAAGVAPPPPPPLPPPPSLPSLSLYLNSGSSGLRGGPVCRAEACLYIGGLPPGLTEAALVAELSRLGNVESVHPFDQQQVLQQHPPHGGLSGSQVPLGEEVYVVFVSLRDAAICYEAVARTCLFGGTRPLVVEFCSAFPADSPAARRCVAAAAVAAAGGGGTNSTASEFLWVSLSAGAGVTPESVVTVLQAASIPVPQQILQVAGRAPGMLLHMASAASVPQVAACLQAHFVQLPLPPPPAVTTSAAATGIAGLSLPPPPVIAAAQAMPSGAGGHYNTPLYVQQASGSGSMGSGVDSCNFRTIWIGQLHESVREEELLAACRVHGDVVGHRLLRTSHCAFVDFASQAGAEAAKRALHGTRLGPQHIRVEWKLDTSLSSRAPLTLRHGSAPLPINASGNHVAFGLGPGAPGLAASPSCVPGIGLPGSAGHSLAGQGLPQPSPAAAGMGMLGQHMTPQAMAAANVAAAAAAAAARGAFSGNRSGADRWAPVVMPLAPTNTATPSPATASMGNTGQLASGGATGFLTSNQVPLQTPGQPQQHLSVGPFGTGVMNATVAVTTRPTAPMLIPHQQIVAGLSGGVMLTHSMVLQQQGSSFATQQQPQLLHTHAAAPSGSGGGALAHASLPSQPHTPAQMPVHLQPMGGYPGPPPLQQQGPLGLHGHSTAPLILSQQHTLGIGGPSPQHTTQQQQPQHAHSHPPGQLQQQRPSDWPQHGQGVTAGGTHSTASPGLPGPGGTLAQLQRFESSTGSGMPLPNSPPILLDGITAATASGGGAPVAGPPQPALPHAHSQHVLPQAKQGAAQQHGSAPIHIHQIAQQPHSHTHAHTLHQQLPPPPSLQNPQQQQQSHHLLQQQQLVSPPNVTWQGGLAKSGSLVCTLQCTMGGTNAAGATPGEREPVTWPATLDVKLRVDLSYVIHSLYSHTAPHARAMRRLVTAGGPDQRTKLSDFMAYLLDKNRAGVIKLEVAAGLPPRTLYLVPPSEQVCAALGAEWTAEEPFLLALVVPTASGNTGANKG